MEGYKSYKGKWYKGVLTGNGDTDWWTKEDWDEHNAYVEELKSKGEYGQEYKYTVNYKEDLFDEFEKGMPKSDSSYISNFGLLIPLGKFNSEDVPKLSVEYKSNKDDLKLL